MSSAQLTPKTPMPDAAETAMATTMEAMAFEQAIPASEPEEKPDCRSFWATVNIYEPQGTLTIVVTEPCARDLVDSIHGTMDEEEVPEEYFYDTLAEMINTLAGRFLNEMFPERGFEMGLPLTGEGQGPRQADLALTKWFTINEHYIQVFAAGKHFKAMQS